MLIVVKERHRKQIIQVVPHNFHSKCQSNISTFQAKNGFSCLENIPFLHKSKLPMSGHQKMIFVVKVGKGFLPVDDTTQQKLQVFWKADGFAWISIQNKLERPSIRDFNFVVESHFRICAGDFWNNYLKMKYHFINHESAPNKSLKFTNMLSPVNIVTG